MEGTIMDAKTFIEGIEPGIIFEIVQEICPHFKANIDEICKRSWPDMFQHFRDKYQTSFLEFFNRLDPGNQKMMIRYYLQQTKLKVPGNFMTQEVPIYIAYQFLLWMGNFVPLQRFCEDLEIEMPERNTFTFFEERFDNLPQEKKEEYYKEFMDFNDKNEYFYDALRIHFHCLS